MSKYTIVGYLDDTQVDTLVNLAKPMYFVEAHGSRRRVGRNGPNALSMYSVTKWFNWNKAQREVFREHFPEVYRDKIVQGWFLKYPKDIGFLDIMDAWANTPYCGTIVAISLRDNQSMKIEDTLVTLQKGEIIKFHLGTTHSVPRVKDEHLWACLMVRI